jgi:methylglutaconyl-CoA hydratase
MIKVDRDQRGVATLRLAHAAALNRFDATMVAALQTALEGEAQWPGLRALVLRGEGRHFCAGADIAWLQHCARAGDPPRLTEALLTLDTMPCPVITLVHGACIGAGVGLVAASDIVLAAEDAFFSIAVVRLGLPTAAMTPLLVRAIGARQARRYAISGERIDAPTARHLGLVHEVATLGALPVALDTVLAAILAGAPGAQAETKRLIATAGPFDKAACALDETMPATLRCAEAREGLAAFTERRTPIWVEGT